jgi:hypothetical protein
MNAKYADAARRHGLFSIGTFALLGVLWAQAALADLPGGITEHDIIPIMLRRCTVCHGPRTREADLDLRSRSAMLKGGKSGPALVPGRPGDSLLIQKIRAGEMPPLRRVVEVSVKPIETAETELLAQWIELGAPEAPASPDSIISDPDPLVSNRSFWSFRPPGPVSIPTRSAPELPEGLVGIKPGDRAPLQTRWESVRNSIDAFVLEKLHQRGRSFSPEAARSTLMRRAYLDLTGLPPEPSDVLQFLGDDDPDAYEKMIDRLLASPRYGERWGRHWLDLAGYADSEGKTDQDLRRPFAWRYRDYVIRSFNADKPYDRFLLEQIAGDELADYEHTAEITPEIYDNLVATGFLRMAPDGTFANITNFVPDRLEVIADEIQVLGSAVMGLTLHCARCHNHKFDPIAQRDYYRLLDIFKGAFDEHDWLKPNVSQIASSGDWKYRLLPHVPAEERRQWQTTDDKLKGEIAKLKAGLQANAEPVRKKYVDERLAKLPAQLHEDLRQMLATPPAERSEVQKYLADKFEKALTIELDELGKIDGEFKKLAEETDKAVTALESKRQPAPMIHALWDRGSPSPTYVLRRGDYLTPAQLVGPGVPSVLTDAVEPFTVKPPWPGARSTGRRLAFAHWLTKPNHPLTARVMVNRIWKHHFGTGLVKTLANFGTTGDRPTHPELLDWLAIEFVRQGWSIKAMHRLMMTSTTYRQASEITEYAMRDGRLAQTSDDGNDSCTVQTIELEDELCGRMRLRRMDAEVLYDTMVFVAGRLDERRYGKPDAVEVSKDGQVTPVATEQGWRRSIYVEQRRKQIPTLLEDFDLPQMNPNCVERSDSNVAPQALHLWNNAMIHQLAANFAVRVANQAGPDPDDWIDWVYLTALSRTPTHEEKQIGLQALARLTEQWSQRAVCSSAADGAAPINPAMRALTNFCHAIMNSAEFLYVD